MNARDLPPIPVLRLEATAPDEVALDTWREVLSSALGPWLPHSLLALWLFDAAGQPVLIGPPALAEDNLEVPRPSPRIDPRQLEKLEDILRRAGYASALALGIPLGEEDVGLMLVADFPKGLYGEDQLDFLRRTAEAIGPSLGRVVRMLGGVAPATDSSAGVVDELLPALGRALAAATPKGFAEALSAALQPVLPHDRLAIVAREPTLPDLYLLSGHEQGTLWSEPGLVIPAAAFDADGAAEGRPSFLTADTARGRPVWPPLAGAAPMRSVAGALLQGADRALGWLLVGSAAPGLLDDAARARLEAVAPLVAPRVEAALLAFQAQVLRSHLGVLRNVPASLARVAELLGTTPQLGAGLRLVAREAASLLPLARLEVAVRTGPGDEVAMLGPGEVRPLPELPVASAAGTDLGRVVRGEQPNALATGRPGSEVTGALIVPLRVAGRITGALVLHAAGPEGFSRPDAALAQQLADVLAPHVELARRTHGAPGPNVPVPPSIRRPASYGRMDG
jgi:GAF domain-containing protein